MGEALIVGRGGGSSGGSGTIKTVIINTNTTWVVPKTKDQVFHVRIFGGGAGGVKATGYWQIQQNGNGSGGGGGMMNNGILYLNSGESVKINIGRGGGDDSNTSNVSYGGTTFFGNYMMALGGGPLSVIDATIKFGINNNKLFIYDSINHPSGSCGGCYSKANIKQDTTFISTGAIQFGGGGCYTTSYTDCRGGKWGGGGGYGLNNSNRPIGGTVYSCYYDIDDGYINARYTPESVSGLAGNGGTLNRSANNGINTIGNKQTLTDYEFIGAGKCGTNNNSSSTNYCTGGGGGFGGNGGHNVGGGGGYGANGGNNIGGGGGYGGDGGDGAYLENTSNSKGYYLYLGGGGGGYGKSGRGGNATQNGGIAAGGGGWINNCNNPTYGGNGICIIQYYE